jgi:ketosteroid isomerase-like protein
VSLSAEDSLAILQLVTEADDRASARDAEGYVELFTEDGVLIDAAGTATGWAELVATVAAVWFDEPSGALYLTLNPTIDETDDDPAVYSVMLIVIPGGSPRIFAAARVRQTVRWTPEGWRIAVREYMRGTS